MKIKTVTEPERKIPIKGEFDVLVVGAGPAGFSTALSAAKMGAKVAIVEQSGVIGGIATAGLMSHWGGSADSSILRELLLRVNKPWPEEQLYCESVISHGKLGIVMKEMLLEHGVEVFLYTFAADAIMSNNKIIGVAIENKSGRQALLSKVIVDASGDGDIAAKAGAEFTKGREGDNKMQPVTLMFSIGGVDEKCALYPGSFESNLDTPRGKIQDLASKHLPRPAGHALLYRSALPGVAVVNMTNVTGMDGTNTDDLVRADTICRSQILPILNFIREFVPGYSHSFLLSIASFIGVRETRHFIGEYTLNENDILNSRTFDDWIVVNAQFNFDIHNVDGPGLDKNGAQHNFPKINGYSIPYRSFVPKTVDGLLLAGRNISGTHKAHSNYRVMTICAAMGEGVGIAAAMASMEQIEPRYINVASVQSVLKKRGIAQ